MHLITSLYLTVLVLALMPQLCSSQAQRRKIPTAEDIEDYDDPVLREIFKKKIPPVRYNPDPPPYLPAGYQPQNPNFPNYSYGTVPAFGGQQPQGYVPNQPPMQPWGTLAVQGASTLYNGAQTFGNAFGIQPAQYSAPLVGAAASFLGR